VTIRLPLLWVADVVVAPVAATPLVALPLVASLLGPAPTLSSGIESFLDKSICIVPPCFKRPLWKISFTLSDCRVLNSSPILIVVVFGTLGHCAEVLFGTMPYAGGGRVIVANPRGGATHPKNFIRRSRAGSFKSTAWN